MVHPRDCARIILQNAILDPHFEMKREFPSDAYAKAVFEELRKLFVELERLTGTEPEDIAK